MSDLDRIRRLYREALNREIERGLHPGLKPLTEEDDAAIFVPVR